MSKKIKKHDPEVRKDFSEDPSDVISRQCKELDEWREKYRELSKKYEEQLEGTSQLVAQCNDWRNQYRELNEKVGTLEKSNKLMEEELERLRKMKAKHEKNERALGWRLKKLMSRGLFARMFNTEV